VTNQYPCRVEVLSWFLLVATELSGFEEGLVDGVVENGIEVGHELVTDRRGRTTSVIG
jgi:hypothetical protein